MRILGIDPGLKGALALLEDGQMLGVEDIKSADSRIDGGYLSNLMGRWKPDFCVCEAVTARPGQGVTSMFSFGYALGTIAGVLSALGIPFLLIRPQVWQSHFKLETTSKDSKAHKQEIANRAKKHFPEASLYGPKGALRDGRSDALMIAQYGHEHLSKAPVEAFITAHARKAIPKRRKTIPKVRNF